MAAVIVVVVVVLAALVGDIALGLAALAGEAAVAGVAVHTVGQGGALLEREKERRNTVAVRTN